MLCFLEKSDPAFQEWSIRVEASMLAHSRPLPARAGGVLITHCSQLFWFSHLRLNTFCRRKMSLTRSLGQLAQVAGVLYRLAQVPRPHVGRAPYWVGRPRVGAQRAAHLCRFNIQ